MLVFVFLKKKQTTQIWYYCYDVIKPGIFNKFIVSKNSQVYSAVPAVLLLKNRINKTIYIKA